MLRDFLIGAVFSVVIEFISPYTVIAIQPMGMSADFITAGAIFCLLFIVGVLNPILRLLKDPLNSRELRNDIVRACHSSGACPLERE